MPPPASQADKGATASQNVPHGQASSERLQSRGLGLERAFGFAGSAIAQSRKVPAAVLGGPAWVGKAILAPLGWGRGSAASTVRDSGSDLTGDEMNDENTPTTAQPVILEAVGVAAGAAVGTATVSVRTNFAVQHMLAAARFSRRVAAVEGEHVGELFGDFWGEILHDATGCVLTAVASVEAYANELFFDRATAFPGYSSELLDKLWETFEQKPTLEKFGFALILRGKPPLDMGTRLQQDVAAVIELRNSLTHFKPEWDTEAVRHKKLSERLKGRFVPSPFLNDALIFPRRWATHSCTQWAVGSCLAFAAEFERIGDLPTKYGNLQNPALLIS